MRKPFTRLCLGHAVWPGLLFIPVLAAAAPHLPPALESRLAQIYEQRAFEAKPVSPGQWLEQGGYTLFEPAAEGHGDDLVRYDPASGQREVLVLASQLKPVGSSAPLSFDPHALSPGAAYTFSPDATQVLLVANVRADEHGITIADYWLLDRGNGLLKQLAAEVQEPVIGNAFSPDGSRIVYTQGHNLYVRDLHSGTVTQLTADGVAGSVGNGVSEWGDALVRWSPDGKSIAYLQCDVSRMGRFPLVNYTKATYPDVHYQRFPKVGTEITAVRVGVVPASGGKTQWMAVPADAAGHYIEQLAWTADSSRVVIQKLSRGRDIVEVLLADPSSGAITRLHREENKAWVRDSGFARDFSMEWIDNAKAFTWLSERDGWRRAYAISNNGKKHSALTPESADVISVVKVDERNGWLYYIAAPDNATQRYLYRISLRGGGRAERITPQQPGTHDYDISPDGRFALHAYSSADSPPLTDLIELQGHRVVRVLQNNDALRANFKSWGARPTEFFKIRIDGGIEMDAWMLKPRDFDPAKKYPLFIYVYGEPAAQTVLDRWSMSHQLFHRAIADAGYLVVSIDNRCTPAPKGSAWRRADFPRLGPLSTEEQSAALKELARQRSYVDASRVAIWGWSAGGTNTLNALFRKPDQYHVGIALVPKPRPELYNAWFQEIYMRTPQMHPEDFKVSAAINYAQGLKGDLLIVTGSGETNTHVQIIDHLVNRLIELGKPFDYMVYPNRDHSMREGAATRPHLYRLIARYLTDHLPAGPQ